MWWDGQRRESGAVDYGMRAARMVGSENEVLSSTDCWQASPPPSAQQLHPQPPHSAPQAALITSRLLSSSGDGWIELCCLILLLFYGTCRSNMTHLWGYSSYSLDCSNLKLPLLGFPVSHSGLPTIPGPIFNLLFHWFI